jgi:hypothetical protein
MMTWLHLVSYFFGGLFPGQRHSAFRQRHYGKTLSDAVREASGEGSLVFDSECSMGLRESLLRLSASAARRTLRSAIHRLRRAVCGWRAPHQPAVGTSGPGCSAWHKTGSC